MISRIIESRHQRSVLSAMSLSGSTKRNSSKHSCIPKVQSVPTQIESSGHPSCAVTAFLAAQTNWNGILLLDMGIYPLVMQFRQSGRSGSSENGTVLDVLVVCLQT